jgi:hypothetical protein
VNARMLFRQRGRIIVLLLLCLVSMTLPASAAVQVRRPIVYDGGRINQHYLWGEDSHHGVDFSYATGTDVYAVADGVVSQIRESIADDTHPPNCDDWGNFALIRHNAQHWNRITQQWAYVYSLYAHLQHDSVRLKVGDAVTAGQWIAEVDNTGQSTGSHLHLQFCIHPQPDRTWVPDTCDQWNTSRNPELWLQPFNYGGTNTGTVVGRVSDSNGNPVGNLRIYGLSKPLGSSDTNYVWSETYHDTWANPDDILAENWGTTDVYSGTYHLEAKYTNGTLYRDLGWYTVMAGKITYVGLYPVYLPDIKSNSNGWNSSIVIRNNSTSRTAQVVTTFFYTWGQVHSQRTDYIASGATLTFAPSGTLDGSAVVVASEDVAVVVENYNLSNSSAYAYNGIAAADSLNPGWGQVGTTIYLPDLTDNNYGWSTSVTILNAGSGTANFDFDYYGQNSGGPYQGPQGSLAPNASVTYDQTGSPCPTVGAGRITGDQPLAVIVREYSGNVNMAYSGFGGGATTAYLPLLMDDNYGWHTGIAVQNLGAAATNVTVNYYPAPGFSNRNPDTVYAVQPNATAIVGQWGSGPWVGSAQVTASQPIAAIVNENVSGKGSSYSGFAGGSSLVVLPDVRNDGGWTSGIQIQNLDGSDAAVVVRVNGNDVWAGTILGYRSVAISSGQIVGSGFRGPAVVECTNGRRIAAIVNLHDLASASDKMMTYDGINR